MTHKKPLPAPSVLDRLALLPWWVGVAVGLVALVGLHRVAEMPGSGWMRMLAHLGAVLVPVLCLLAAVLSVWLRRAVPQAQPAPGPAAAAVSAPHPPDFEDTVPPCPLCNGAMVRRTPRQGPGAGRAMWMCLNHPDCEGRREAE